MESPVGFCSRATRGATRREFEAVQPPRTARSHGPRDLDPSLSPDCVRLLEGPGPSLSSPPFRSDWASELKDGGSASKLLSTISNPDECC
jgi:hypothetical protein